MWSRLAAPLSRSPSCTRRRRQHDAGLCARRASWRSSGTWNAGTRAADAWAAAEPMDTTSSQEQRDGGVLMYAVRASARHPHFMVPHRRSDRPILCIFAKRTHLRHTAPYNNSQSAISSHGQAAGCRVSPELGTTFGWKHLVRHVTAGPALSCQTPAMLMKCATIWVRRWRAPSASGLRRQASVLSPFARTDDMPALEPCARAIVDLARSAPLARLGSRFAHACRFPALPP